MGLGMPQFKITEKQQFKMTKTDVKKDKDYQNKQALMHNTLAIQEDLQRQALLHLKKKFQKSDSINVNKVVCNSCVEVDNDAKAAHFQSKMSKNNDRMRQSVDKEYIDIATKEL